MGLIVTPQPISSPFAQATSTGVTTSDGMQRRLASNPWHLVIVRHAGRSRVLAVGPCTAAGTIHYEAEAEIVWLAFRFGVFMPHLPVQHLVDREVLLPDAGTHKFWLQGSAWDVPDVAHADVFVERLARRGLLLRDPLVEDVLHGRVRDVAPRTLRQRFKQATGLARKHASQVDRAQQAILALRQGTAISDVVAELGYYDQSHLTNALRRWFGVTPAQPSHQDGRSPP